MIEHDNIFYIRDLSEIGGVETFVWEMVKKFKDNDIAVVYKMAHPNQLKRIREYCKAYKHTNQKIKCKVAIINYDTSIIDYIDEGADIYQVIHGDYENPVYKWKPPTNDRIKEYIGVTKHIRDSFMRITGLKNVIYSYNPLSVEKNNKIILLSATRLSPIKGKNRMIKLANALDKANIDYLWYIFTNDIAEINSPNVIYMKPRLDIGYWMEHADYIVQLSDTEACSYTINEALYRNKPVIVTPLPYLEEIGVKNGENAYIMAFDCSNIDEIVENIKNIPRFEFKHLKDKYDEIIVKGKSKYEEEKNMKVKVKAKAGFVGKRDAERNVWPKLGEEWVTDLERAEYLESKNVVEIIETIKEEKPKKEVVVETKEEKPKKTKSKKK